MPSAERVTSSFVKFNVDIGYSDPAEALIALFEDSNHEPLTDDHGTDVVPAALPRPPSVLLNVSTIETKPFSLDMTDEDLLLFFLDIYTPMYFIF